MERENLVFEINNYINDKNVSYKEKLDLILSYIKKLAKKDDLEEMMYWLDKWERLYNEWKEKIENNKGKNKTEKDFLVKSFKKYMMFKMNLEILNKKGKEVVKVVEEDEIFG